MSDLEAKEVSLVKRGANKKRRFPVFKQENQMDAEAIEILKAVMDEEIENEVKLLEWIEKQKLGEKEANALKGAMRILNGFKDNAAIKKVMDGMAGMVGYPAPKAKEPAIPEPPKKDEEKKTEKSKEGDDVSTETKIPEAVQKQLDEAKAETVELKKALDDEKCKRELGELVQKCKNEFPLVPGMSAGEMGEMLLDSSEENRKLLEKQWAATQESIEKSKLLQTAGSGGANMDGSDAKQKLDEIAKGIVEKSGEPLTYEKAFVRAMDENPELYNQYLDDNPAQTGARR